MLFAFFALTFAVTWTIWLAAAARPDVPLSGLGGPLFLLGVFAPGIVALALLELRGRGDAARLLGRVGRWQVSAHWYLFAIGFFAATKLGAAVMHRLTSGAWPVFGETPLWLMLASIPVSTWFQAGEEVGWRGFALPRLSRPMGLAGASLALGVVWAVWHLPLFFLAGSGSDGQSFPVYLLHVTALSVVMSWLYWRTESSLLLVMVMHASVNNTTAIVPTALPGASDPLSFSASPIAWLTVGLTWAAAVPMLVAMRGAKLDAPTVAEPPLQRVESS